MANAIFAYLAHFNISIMDTSIFLTKSYKTANHIYVPHPIPFSFQENYNSKKHNLFEFRKNDNRLAFTTQELSRLQLQQKRNISNTVINFYPTRT